MMVGWENDNYKALPAATAEKEFLFLKIGMLFATYALRGKGVVHSEGGDNQSKWT